VAVTASSRASRFVPSPLEAELVAAARELLEAEAVPLPAAPERSAGPELWHRVRRLGWAGITVPEAHGGLGLGFGDLCAIAEAGGRVLLGLPIADTAVCARAVERWAPAAASRFLPALATGDGVGTTAFDADTTLTAVPVGARLSGNARFVIHGASADVLCLFVHQPEPALVLLGPDELAMVTRRDVVQTDRTRPLAHLRFDDISVPADAVLLTGEDALRARDIVRAERATALAAECAGGADRILALTTAYAQERQQFGRPIGGFQAVKHKLASVLALVEHSRTAWQVAAAGLVDGGPRMVEHAALAKAYCGDAFVRAASDGIQVHGGIGFTWEHPAHLYFKRAVVNAGLVWSSVACREHLRRALFDDGASWPT
jgi:alkylation response protein AidB-like acyl-CoA dehydrogenase